MTTLFDQVKQIVKNDMESRYPDNRRLANYITVYIIEQQVNGRPLTSGMVLEALNKFEGK